MSPWKVMTGRYTGEGDVRDLLIKSDDMFVIARPGDEIALAFDAMSLCSPLQTHPFGRVVRHMLRLVVSGSDPPIAGKWGGSTPADLRLHGSLGRDRRLTMTWLTTNEIIV